MCCAHHTDRRCGTACPGAYHLTARKGRSGPHSGALTAAREHPLNISAAFCLSLPCRPAASTVGPGAEAAPPGGPRLAGAGAHDRPAEVQAPAVGPAATPL